MNIISDFWLYARCLVASGEIFFRERSRKKTHNLHEKSWWTSFSVINVWFHVEILCIICIEFMQISVGYIVVKKVHSFHTVPLNIHKSFWETILNDFGILFSLVKCWWIENHLKCFTYGADVKIFKNNKNIRSCCLLILNFKCSMQR